MSQISGYHPPPLSTDGAQEDFDFSTQRPSVCNSVSGPFCSMASYPRLSSFIRAARETRMPSTIIRQFPFRKPRKSTGGANRTSQDRATRRIPVGAARLLGHRLNERGLKAEKTSRFGLDSCDVAHALRQFRMNWSI